MGREFELKFTCSPENFDSLRDYYSDFRQIRMETTYYDTFDGRLSNYHWTLRRRMEDDKSICTLKTPCPEGGRNEWEVEAGSIMTAVPKLCKLGAPMDLMSFCVSGVGAVCGAKFTRLSKIIQLPNAVVELSLDQGKLLGGKREMDLMEVEVELKSGSDQAAVAFADSLAAQFGLMPEHRSKHSRALALARGGV